MDFIKQTPTPTICLATVPYGAVVGSLKKDGQHYVYITGNDIDGFVVGAKKLIDYEDSLMEDETAVLIGDDSVDAIAVYDYLHTPENLDEYKKNTDGFKMIVRKALYDEMFDSDTSNITVSGSKYRLRHLAPQKSDNFKNYVDKDQLPVLLAGGLWSDITAWEELGSELASEGYNVYLIELTGGPYTECDGCVDYTYSFLTDSVLPGYVNEVKSLTGKSKIKYVGHSNGARVALDSLTAGKVNPADVDTLVVVGVPGNFSTLSYFAEKVDESGDVAIQRMRDKGLDHVTFSRVGHELDSGWGEVISFASYSTGVDGRISVNLFDQYYDWIHLTNDSQPGNGLNVEYFTLIYGTNGIGSSQDNDEIVSVADELAIFGNILSLNKEQRELAISHRGMPKNSQVQDTVEESLNKEIY